MLTYKLVEHIAVLSTRAGKSKELNVISYDDKPPVVDLRVWKPDRAYTSKGVTLNAEELDILREALMGRREIL